MFNNNNKCLYSLKLQRLQCLTVLTREMSTTMAQFMLRKTCPKNMRTKAPITPESVAAVARAEKMNGAEMKRPTPQITENKTFSRIFLRIYHM